VYVCIFRACAPASAAASTMASARSSERLWLPDISATTNGRWPAPIRCVTISIMRAASVMRQLTGVHVTRQAVAGVRERRSRTRVVVQYVRVQPPHLRMVLAHPPRACSEERGARAAPVRTGHEVDRHGR